MQAVQQIRDDDQQEQNRDAQHDQARLESCCVCTCAAMTIVEGVERHSPGTAVVMMWPVVKVPSVNVMPGEVSVACDVLRPVVSGDSEVVETPSTVVLIAVGVVVAGVVVDGVVVVAVVVAVVPVAAVEVAVDVTVVVVVVVVVVVGRVVVVVVIVVVVRVVVVVAVAIVPVVVVVVVVGGVVVGVVVVVGGVAVVVVVVSGADASAATPMTLQPSRAPELPVVSDRLLLPRPRSSWPACSCGTLENICSTTSNTDHQRAAEDGCDAGQRNDIVPGRERRRPRRIGHHVTQVAHVAGRLSEGSTFARATPNHVARAAVRLVERIEVHAGAAAACVP